MDRFWLRNCQNSTIRSKALNVSCNKIAYLHLIPGPNRFNGSWFLFALCQPVVGSHLSRTLTKSKIYLNKCFFFSRLDNRTYVNACFQSVVF